MAPRKEKVEKVPIDEGSDSLFRRVIISKKQLLIHLHDSVNFYFTLSS